MAFKDIFKDNNDYNEKSIIGFGAFAVMVIFASADVITGIHGKDLVINENVYNSLELILNDKTEVNKFTITQDIDVNNCNPNN